MGLFDFLKPKKGMFDRFEKNPRFRTMLLHAASEEVAKRAENLRALGRKEDADKVITEYLKKVFEEFRNEPDNPRHLSLLTSVALRLAALQAGKQTLESVIEGNDRLNLDLTLVYTDLGSTSINFATTQSKSCGATRWPRKRRPHLAANSQPRVSKRQWHTIMPTLLQIASRPSRIHTGLLWIHTKGGRKNSCLN
jgi:hypothetical protein